MKKVIYQYSCVNSNVGDNALTIGLINSFSEYKNITIKNHSLRNINFTPKYIKKINEECDMIIIGGGGLLHYSNVIMYKRQHTSGTLWNIDPNNINLITVPLVIYAVGYNVFKGEQNLSLLSKTAIIKMIEKAKIFSVRNDGSREKLIKFLCTNKYNSKIIKIPDPGLYVDYLENKTKLNYQLNKKYNIAIQLAFDRIKFRYKNINVFIKAINTVINKLGANINVWIVPHVEVDLEYIKKYFNKNIISYLPKYEDAKLIMNFYKKMDLVIGMRGHANICCFGLQIPIISLGSHDKTEGFMKDVGFHNMYIDINSINLETKLLKLIKYALENKISIINKINLKLKHLIKETKNINNKIVNELYL